MQSMYEENFEKYWNKFITQIRGQMMNQVKQGIFTYSSLNLILAGCVGFWEFRDSEGGRWLDGYEKEHPKQAELIRKILLEDMKFTEEPISISKNNYMKYAAVAGGAAVGLLASKMTGAGNVASTVLTIAPAVAAYPIAGNIADSLTARKADEMMAAYVRQLDKYRLSVESILRNS